VSSKEQTPKELQQYVIVFKVWIFLLSAILTISEAEMTMQPSSLLFFESTAVNQTTVIIVTSN